MESEEIFNSEVKGILLETPKGKTVLVYLTENATEALFG